MPLSIVVMPPFDREFFDSRDRLSLDAATIYDLIEKLDAIAPGFADQVDVRAAFAIDGAFASDWTVSLAGVREVILLPRIGGG